MRYKNRYHRLCYRYLKDAREAIKQKKYTQVSEKLWGVASQIIKAVAEKNGWRHKTYKALEDIIIALTEKTKDMQLFDLFNLASALHQNFYKEWLSPKHIKLAFKSIKYFVEKMERLFLDKV